MNLAIFGGTGRTGRLLVSQALAAGHRVAALARTPSRLAMQSERLRVVRGDALDPAGARETVAGAEAIISLLGPEKDAPPLAVSRATANIVAAAGELGVRRLIVVVGAGVGDPLDHPRAVDRAMIALLKLAAREAYDDMSATADCARSSDLDWTLVRVPRLTDDPPKGEPTAGYLGRGAGMRLSRGQLAAFLLRQIVDPTHLRKAPVVSDRGSL